MSRENRQTDAGRNAVDNDTADRQFKRSGQCLHDLAGNPLNALRIADFDEDDDKFVTPLTCHGVAAAHTGKQPLGGKLQQLVADIMAMHVIDLLEVVEIKKRHRHQPLVAPRLSQRLIETILHQTTIGQPGQRIEIGKLANVLLIALARADVLDLHVKALRQALRVAQHRSGQLHPEQAAIFLQVALFGLP